jgi:hypothetical protein
MDRNRGLFVGTERGALLNEIKSKDRIACDNFVLQFTTTLIK